MNISQDKIKELEKYLKELEKVIPQDFEEYIKNLEKRLACERAFEKIIQSVNDLAILIIKKERLTIPDENTKAFEVLSKKNIISSELATNLKKAMGMRNFLAHQYGNIDDEVVFEEIQKEITKDVKEFLREVQK